MQGLKRFCILLLATSAALALSSAAWADKIKNPTAVFSGLDKITGRIVSFEVAVDETVQFGSLQLTPRVCYSRPETEASKTTSFIEVGEVDAANQLTNVFSGWVFAASPGLSAIDHAVYDLWLTSCKGGTVVIKSNEDEEQAQLIEAVPDPNAANLDDQELAPKLKKKGPKQEPSKKFFPTAITPLDGEDVGAPIQLTPN